jgi:hypothetical protein
MSYALDSAIRACHHLPVAAGDPVPAAGRDLQTYGGWHHFPGPLLPSPRPTSRFTTHVPAYDLTAAAGFWGSESQPEEIGWTEVPGVAVKPGMFVARVTGTSMKPLIPDGSWCLFRPCRPGSREGRIVLVQFAHQRYVPIHCEASYALRKSSRVIELCRQIVRNVDDLMVFWFGRVSGVFVPSAFSLTIARCSRSRTIWKPRASRAATTRDLDASFGNLPISPRSPARSR